MARVLIIDDETELRAMVREMLENKSHEIQEASDGEEALVKCMADLADAVEVLGKSA